MKGAERKQELAKVWADQGARLAADKIFKDFWGLALELEEIFNNCKDDGFSMAFAQAKAAGIWEAKARLEMKLEALDKKHRPWLDEDSDAA